MGKNSLIVKGYIITIFRVVVGSVTGLFITALLSYGLSIKGLPGNGLFTFIIVFTMLFDGGLIPNYLVIRELGLIDSIWVYIFPLLVIPWNFIIMRNFFQAIPRNLLEASLIDGANEVQTLIYVVVPVSKAIFATVGLFIVVMHWNAWFDAIIYINDKKKFPVQVVLNELIKLYDPEALRKDMDFDIIVTEQPNTEAIKRAGIVLATAPIVMIYPFIQKYFVKGVIVGSLKG
jgi:putative aldouronate transport system permease protein